MKSPGTLAQLELFRSLTPSELEKLEELLVIKDYRNGHCFCKEGAQIRDNHRALFLILDGLVAVSTERDDPAYVPVARSLKAGEIFGLISFFHGAAYSATCSASGPVRVASLARAEFDKLCTSDAALGASIMFAMARQLARDIRACNARLVTEIRPKSAI